MNFDIFILKYFENFAKSLIFAEDKLHSAI